MSNNPIDIIKAGSKKISDLHLQIQRLSTGMKTRVWQTSDGKFLGANVALLCDAIVELKRVDYDMQAAMADDMQARGALDPNGGHGGHEEEAGGDDPREARGGGEGGQRQAPAPSAQEVARQTYEHAKAMVNRLASEALGKSGTPAPMPPTPSAPVAVTQEGLPPDQRPATMGDAFDAFKAIGNAILDAPPPSESVTGEQVVHAEGVISADIVSQIPGQSGENAPASVQTIEVSVAGPSQTLPQNNDGRPSQRSGQRGGNTRQTR